MKEKGNFLRGILNSINVRTICFSAMLVLLLAGTAGAAIIPGTVTKLADVKDDYDPSYSPDGSKVVFSVFEPSNPQLGSIWILNLTTGVKSQMNLPSSTYLYTKWSPAGDKIMYVKWVTYGGASNICTANLDGSNEACLTTDQNLYADHPSYSSDGSKIVYSAHVPGTDAGDIWVMDSDGTHKTQLTNDPEYQATPAFSPDGTKIIYASGNIPNDHLWIMNADGTNKVQLTSGTGMETEPAWSPDGTYIAYQKTDCQNTCPWNIWVMKADGSEQTQLTNWAANGIDGATPAWHPGGNKLVFVSNGMNSGNNNWDIYEMTIAIFQTLDNTPPEITIAAPSNTNYILHQPVIANWTATDNESGINATTATAVNGALVDTATTGTKTFTVTATDNAGNIASKTVIYRVVYNYSGILQPINADGSSIFKLGSTVNVKFRLIDAIGNNVTEAVAKIYFAKIDNSVVGTELEANSTSAATTGNLFRYDSTSDQYIFNWGTKGLTVGTYQIRIELDDGMSYYVKIGLK